MTSATRLISPDTIFSMFSLYLLLQLVVGRTISPSFRMSIVSLITALFDSFLMPTLSIESVGTMIIIFLSITCKTRYVFTL